MPDNGKKYSTRKPTEADLQKIRDRGGARTHGEAKALKTNFVITGRGEKEAPKAIDKSRGHIKGGSAPRRRTLGKGINGVMKKK